MLRRALPSLFCAFALVAPAYSQDVFVPRQLKAIPVHPPKENAEVKPPKPKEIVRRAEPVTDADLKAATKETSSTAETAKAKIPKPEPVVARTEKKEKSVPVKEEKSAVVTEKGASKKVAKSEPAKEKSEKVPAPKEKPAPAKTPSEDVTTIKVEKATVAKEPAATKPVAKTDAAKEKKEKDSDLPVIKIEKAATAKKEPAPPKAIAKSESAKVEVPKEKTEKVTVIKEKPPNVSVAKTAAARNETTIAKAEKAQPAKEETARKAEAKADTVKVETVTARTEKATQKDNPATVAVSKSLQADKALVKEESTSKTPKTESTKPEVTVAKTEKSAPAREKEKEKEKPATAAAKSPGKPETLIAKAEPAPPREGSANLPKSLPAKSDQVSVLSQKEPPQVLPTITSSLNTGFTKIADGFDFPVGKPEAEGYYKARGFRPGGHVGEDWDGIRGGDTDLRDPIYSIGDGIVVFARDVHLGWGNVIIVRHAYRESGNVRYIDALYGHLNTMLVSRGQRVTRGQQIGTMGTAHGQYDAHLHFEIRKNLEIGMSRSKFQKSFSNYYDPTQFINSHRRLPGGGANYKVAMNTFTHDWMYRFDKNRNFSSRKRSTSESSAALRRALTSR